jgi:hypothetical protein
MREYTFCVYTYCEYTLREYTLCEYTLCEYTFCKCTLFLGTVKERIIDLFQLFFLHVTRTIEPFKFFVGQVTRMM